ncbi:MAG: HAMP domain-containing protein [Burkholderiales bacterium]|nr:HAMP domain-containing protein [Burkholderiales bacterium]
MSVVPRTLLWRSFLLISLLMIISVAAWFQILRSYDREPRARQLAQMVVSVVNLTRAALVTAKADKRRELLAELSEREGIRVYPAETEDKLLPSPDGAFVRMLHAEIRRKLGEDTRFASGIGELRGFFISFHIDEDEYWVVLPRERLERQFPWQWLGWTALALLLSLIGAWLIVSRINRPLKALAAAAGDIGQGRTPPPLPESGPVEIQTLAHSFNRMSQDLARLDADRALILAGVSHDLRTPLSRLRLSTEMSASDEALKQGMIADIAEMDAIIGQFLDFARTQNEEPLAPTDIAELAREVLEHQNRLGHALQANIEATPVQALRRTGIKRMISNLVDNALAYGGGEVCVATRSAGGKLIIEVLDRGPGIPPQEAERLKQPFTRLEQARSGKGGSGLGLAIVDRIVHHHGGSFELLPREGGGLVARVSLPLEARTPSDRD